VRVVGWLVGFDQCATEVMLNRALMSLRSWIVFKGQVFRCDEVRTGVTTLDRATLDVEEDSIEGLYSTGFLPLHSSLRDTV
jgi:hypothetical protein